MLVSVDEESTGRALQQVYHLVVNAFCDPSARPYQEVTWPYGVDAQNRGRAEPVPSPVLRLTQAEARALVGWYRVNGFVPQGGRMVSPECVCLVELLRDFVEALGDRWVKRDYFLCFLIVCGSSTTTADGSLYG